MKKVLGILLFIVIIGGAYLYYDFVKARLASRENLPQMNVSYENVESSLSNFLPQLILASQFNGKVFCAYHLYGYDQLTDQSVIVTYIWAYCQEYFLKEGEINLGPGESVPAKIVLTFQDGLLTPKSVQKPKDGDLYAQSLRDLFPAKYYDQAIYGYPIEKLEPSPKKQAENYFE